MKTLKELVKIAGVPVPEGYRYVVQDSNKTVWVAVDYPEWKSHVNCWHAKSIKYLFMADGLCKDHKTTVFDIKEVSGLTDCKVNGCTRNDLHNLVKIKLELEEELNLINKRMKEIINEL